MVRIKLLLIIVIIMLISSGCIATRPRQELVSSRLSPDEKYLLNIYLNNGGATVDYSITASIVDIIKSREWNIYFHYHGYEIPENKWLSNDTVFIDGQKMNIYRDYYESFEYK